MGVLGSPQSTGWGDPSVAPASLVDTLREIAANASRCNSYTFADEAEALARALEPVLPVLEVAAAMLAPKVPPAVRLLRADKGLRVWTLSAETEPTLIKCKPGRRDQLAAAWDCLFSPLRSVRPRPHSAPAAVRLGPLMPRPADQVPVAAVPVRRVRGRGWSARGSGAV